MASNFAEAMQQGYAFGAQQRQDREQRNRLAELAGLSSKVIAGDHAATDRAYAIDPRAAQTYQGEGDRRREQLVNIARGWKQVPSTQRQAYYERFVVPAVTPMGFGDLGQYDEATIDGLADQILAANSGAQSGVGVQSTFVDNQGNRVAIMRDGSTQILGQNAPNNQIIDTGNGFYGVNKGSLSAAPVMIGGQPQQPAQGVPSATFVAEDGSVIPTQQFAAADGSAARFDSGVPQYVRDQILAQPASFGGAPDQSTAMLPPTNRNPQQFGGGQQLYSKTKPEDAPSGYRYGADGKTLEYIPGGPADPFLRNERTSPAAAKPIPPQALGKVLEAQEALGSTRVISDIIKKHADRMQSGELVVGPVDTVGAKFRTGLGMANQQDVNLNEWEADKTKIVNESLRLNKGVQTEGDSQRAIQELMGARDQATAARALRRLAEVNSRAVQLQQEKLRTIYRNYGRGPDGEPVQSAPTQGGGVDDLLSKYGAN